MALVLPNAQKTAYLDTIKTGYFPSPKLHLYKNNFTPVGSMTLGSFTEANFPGYAAQSFSWGTSFLNGSNRGEIDGTLLTFTCTGSATPNDIYGYYVTDATSSTLLYAELNPAGPVTLNGAGQTYTVLPRFTDDTL